MKRYCKVRRRWYSWARVTLLDKNDKVLQGQEDMVQLGLDDQAIVKYCKVGGHGTATLDGQVIVTLLDKNDKVLQG
jgi:hypothetical protein